MKNKLTYRLTAVIAVFILFIFSLCGGGAAIGHAATSASPQEVYESRNVTEDLSSATIDGEGIDYALYNFDEHKNVQIISFVEFCYSYQKDKQSDYGLYVYVYNPRGYDWTKNEQLNKIQLRTGGNSSANFDKFPLKYLNRSEEAGREGLFYKFEIELENEQKAKILDSLNSGGRIYEVGEIELFSSGTSATAYDVSNTYTYKGFAEGYGSASAESDTLTCMSDGLVTLTLDVHPTQYRPEGSSGGNINERDILYSVYFSIPNSILNSYGGLSAVHATWLNAKTRSIAVTGNEEVYTALNDWLWDYQGEADLNNYPEYTLLGNATVKETTIGILLGSKAGRYMSLYHDKAYNISGIVPDFQNGLNAKDKDCYYGVNFSFAGLSSRLDYIFYAENENASDYVLSGSEVLEHIREYTNKFGTGDEAVAGKYNSNLFESWDEEFTDKNIHATDKYTLTSETWGRSFWEKLFGGAHVEYTDTFKNIKAIQAVKASDFKSTVEATCKNLYIEECDYDDFKDYYDKATSRNETTFIFRYYQDKYTSMPVTECKRLTVNGDNCVKKIDTNAYFAQMVVNLDFDIIDVTCSKGKVDTVIPVIMSPIDVVPDVEPPLVIPDDPPASKPSGGNGGCSGGCTGANLTVVAIALVVIFGLVVLKATGLLEWLVNGLLEVITAPFRAIGKLFKRKDKDKPKEDAQPKKASSKGKQTKKKKRKKAGKKK